MLRKSCDFFVAPEFAGGGEGRGEKSGADDSSRRTSRRGVMSRDMEAIRGRGVIRWEIGIIIGRVWLGRTGTTEDIDGAVDD